MTGFIMYGDGQGQTLIFRLLKLMGRGGLFLKKRFLGLGKSWIEGIMDKYLLTQELYNAIMADNNKFKEYWNTHPEEVEEVFRKFSEKFVDMSKKRLTSD